MSYEEKIQILLLTIEEEQRNYQTTKIAHDENIEKNTLVKMASAGEQYL